MRVDFQFPEIAFVVEFHLHALDQAKRLKWLTLDNQVGDFGRRDVQPRLGGRRGAFLRPTRRLQHQRLNLWLFGVFPDELLQMLTVDILLGRLDTIGGQDRLDPVRQVLKRRLLDLAFAIILRRHDLTDDQGVPAVNG